MNQEPIFITGVGKRVGLRLALNFLDRGVPVIGTYRNERPGLVKLRNAGAELYCCDFQDEGQISVLVESILG